MKQLFILIICCYTASIMAQNATIKFVDTSIEMDGDFKESVWKQLPEYTGFYNYLPTDIGLAKNQTSVKLFHNKTNLYIRAIYNDTTVKAQVSTLKRDVSIAFSDAFVIILDTQNQEQNGYFFAVNALGNQTDGLVGRSNSNYNLNFSWNATWQAKTVLNGNKKQYEIAIPLKALNFNKDDAVFGVQFYVRDIKNNSWTIFKNVERNYANLDLRFTEKFTVENLPEKANSRFTVTPSLTSNYQNNVTDNVEETTYKPSLDVQYNLTSSLKLDTAVNPDFSQIDVDRQVTNLTRFSVFFPEQRNFFLENSDLFSNLGVNGINPFYSRRIGASSDIQFGLKLSGNLASKTRIGILNVQSNKSKDIASQNYGVVVGEQQFSKSITATGYLINRQQTNTFKFIGDYNRVTGLNLNYKSKNNKWIGLANLGKSFNDGIANKNTFYNAGIWFNKRGFEWNVGVKTIGRNFITDIGFTPRLYNYDAINNVTVREGYTEVNSGIEYQKFYETSKTLNSFRVLNYRNNTYFDEEGKLNQTSHFLNSAVFFKDLSALYYVFTYDYVDLKYGFDPLGNGNVLRPNTYNYGLLKIGYNSANNQKFRYRFNIQKGQYYSGKRTSGGIYLNYQLLPFANLEASYDINKIDLNELGHETFHLTRFTGEVFFNNRLNWTTYLQYNTQRNSFNVNSRIQWEYKPLSYVYLVLTDNYNNAKTFNRTNWGAAFKINYRLDL